MGVTERTSDSPWRVQDSLGPPAPKPAAARMLYMTCDIYLLLTRAPDISVAPQLVICALRGNQASFWALQWLTKP